MAKRLDAMGEAVKMMRPALQTFYASLADEQKARFNTMNEQAQGGTSGAMGASEGTSGSDKRDFDPTLAFAGQTEVATGEPKKTRSGS